MEEWRVIDGFENFKISKEGVVKNFKTGNIITPQLKNQSYWVRLSNGRKCAKWFGVETLLKRYFAPPCCDDENWQPIQSFPNYIISTCGRVKNLTKGTIMKGSYDKDGYLRVELCHGETRKTCKVHRLVAYAFCGNPTDGTIVPDHIDRDKGNNHASNLRWADFSTNGHNRSKIKGASLKYYGITHYPNKTNAYKATIMKDGVSYYLGYFHTAEDAARAYDAKAREMYGENARTNF
jgi:hypothetical protein